MSVKPDALSSPIDSVHEPAIEWLAERSDERLLLIWAAVIAVFLHGVAFVIDLPVPAAVMQPAQHPSPTIYNHPLPPPPLREAAVLTTIDTTRRRPIPAREMESLEPVVEPNRDVTDDAVFDEAIDFLLAPAVAPPRSAGSDGPVVITPDIQQPVLIEATKVPPGYPEVPRRAGISGDVIVQAVVHRDGSVGEITVLRCTPPGLGFEESAIEAVRQWRYEPAMQLGRPVSVYFTVYVSFDLR